MKKIEGSPKNLKQLLQNTKYSIHIEIVATTILRQKQRCQIWD